MSNEDSRKSEADKSDLFAGSVLENAASLEQAADIADCIGAKSEFATRKQPNKLLAVWLYVGIAFVILLAIAALVFMQPGVDRASRDTALWRTDDLAGQESFDTGKLAEAERQFNAGLKIARSAHDEELEIASLNEQIDLESAKGDLKRRQSLLNEIDSIRMSNKASTGLLRSIEKATAEVKAKETVDTAAVKLLCENANDAVANLLKSGNSKTAKLLVTKTMELAQVALPAEADVNGRCFHNLGDALQDEGDFKGAILYFKKAMECHARAGILSPIMARSYYELARAYLYSNDASLAEKNMMVALQMFRQLVGPQSAEVANCKVQLACIFEAQGIKDRAVEAAKSAISIFEGEEPKVVDELALARADDILARANQDLVASQRALKLCERQVAKPYPLLCEVLLETSELCVPSSLDYAQALLNRASAISKRFTHERSDLIDVDLLFVRGRIHLLKGELSEAKKAFEEALLVRERFHGVKSPQYVDVLTNLALVNVSGGNNQLAERYFKDANVLMAKCGPKQAGYQEALNFLQKEYSRWLSMSAAPVGAVDKRMAK